MNPLRSERDAFRALLLLIAGAVGVAAAGTLGDGWTALATFLALVAGISVGIWIGRQAADASAASAPREPVPGLPVLVVAPVELAGSSLARELATEEEATSVRAVLLRPDEGEGDPTSRPAAELRALLEEFGVAAQVISVARSDAEKAVAAELRDGVLSHVFIATHRRGHPAYAAEEQLVLAIDRASEAPVVAVAFAAT